MPCQVEVWQAEVSPLLAFQAEASQVEAFRVATPCQVVPFLAENLFLNLWVALVAAPQPLAVELLAKRQRTALSWVVICHCPMVARGQASVSWSTCSPEDTPS